MAGKVRQAIDEAAFAKFISENVPQIKTPTELKQVSSRQRHRRALALTRRSLALASRTRRTW